MNPRANMKGFFLFLKKSKESRWLVHYVIVSTTANNTMINSNLSQCKEEAVELYLKKYRTFITPKISMIIPRSNPR